MTDKPIGVKANNSAIGKKLALDYEFMGKQQVKNIAEPVRAYRVLMDAGVMSRVTSREEPALELPDKSSIAVLTFTNMSGNPEQEYFSDGITTTSLPNFLDFGICSSLPISPLAINNLNN